MAACSARASPIHPFSLSSAPTNRIKLFPAASYECRRFVTSRRRPSPRASMTSSSFCRSSWKISCWYFYCRQQNSAEVWAEEGEKIKIPVAMTASPVAGHRKTSWSVMVCLMITKEEALGLGIEDRGLGMMR